MSEHVSVVQSIALCIGVMIVCSGRGPASLSDPQDLSRLHVLQEPTRGACVASLLAHSYIMSARANVYLMRPHGAVRPMY